MDLAVGADQLSGRWALVQGLGEHRREPISELEVVFLTD
jgi:hypothetical protein